MFSRAFVFLFLFCASAFAGEVKWQSAEITLKVTASESFEKNFRDMMTETGNGNLQFALNAFPGGTEPPAWLTVDTSANEKMSGTPGADDVGKPKFFFISAKEIGGDGGDTAKFFLEVSPKWTNSDLGVHKENQNIKVSLQDKALAPKTGVTYKANRLPNFLSINPATGEVTGQAKTGDAGDYNDIELIVTHNASGLSASTIGAIKILADPKPPIWTKTNLPDATEDSPYNASAKDLVTNPMGNPVTFEFITKPAWLGANSTGTLTGTPRKADVKTHQILARVTDTVTGLNATETLSLKVIEINHPPVWSAVPLNLPPTNVKVFYSQPLKGSVTDIDEDTLTFKKISGPAWAKVAADGTLSGTPPRNAGAKGAGKKNTIVVEVTDGEFPVQNDININVVIPNEPPVWSANPVSLPQGKEDNAYNGDLNNYASDPDGDTIEFVALSKPSWLTVNSNGTLSGTPEKNDVKTHTFEVRAIDNISGGNTATMKLVVIKTNHAPEWILTPVIISATEDSPMSESIAKYAKDEDDDDLTFKKLIGGDWATLSADGTFTGTPGADHIGDNTFTVEVSDGVLTATNTIVIKVTHVNHKPFWEPVTMPNADEGKPYSFDLKPFAKDPDLNDTLTFVLTGGPNWASVDKDTGKFTGTPQRDHIGLNEFTVRAVDQDGAFATTTIRVTVNKVNQPPYWSEDPITLEDAFEDQAYSSTIAQYGKDPDGDNLKFEKVSGPGWLQISAAGALSGTPKDGDVGFFNDAKFKITDPEGLSATVTAKGRVNNVNKPPVAYQDNLRFVVTVGEDKTIDLDDPNNNPPLVMDPDGDNLSFTLLSTPPNWLELNGKGELRLRPKHEHIGTGYTYDFEAHDGALGVKAKIIVDVKRDKQPPQWLENPIELVAEVNVDLPTGLSIADKAKDPYGIPITFSKVDGPSWLKVAKDGTLSGKPVNANLGVNSFTVRVANDILSADATLKIDVQYINHPPEWTQDPVVLQNAVVNKNYNQSLTKYVTDKNGDDISFKMLNGPDWAFVTSSGLLIGTPKATDLGLNKLTVRAQDPGGLFDDATIEITVANSAGKPVWTENPVNLGERKVNQTFTFDLKTKVNDPDGDQLFFRLVRGPSWMAVDANGLLTATPDIVGNYTAVFEVNDTQFFVEGGGILTVIDGGNDNKPPEWKEDPVQLGSLPVNKPWSFDLKTKVSDPDGDDLTFSARNAPQWMKVSPDGIVSGTPNALGDFSVVFEAFDGKAEKVPAGGVGKAIDGGGNNTPPEWTIDPIDLGKMALGQDWTFDLKPFAKDEDGDDLTFSLKEGPAWMKVAADGMISGKPDKLGPFIAKFTVSDSKASADTGGLGTVIEGGNNTPPKWTTDPIDLGNIPKSQPYSFNLAPYAKDADGDDLTFSLKEGPAWMKVSADGMISGTPTEVGPFIAKFIVSDSLASDETGGLGTVVDGGGDNDPPIWKPEALNFILVERIHIDDPASAKVNINQPKYVTDPNGDALVKFELTVEPVQGLAALADNGDLSFTPLYPNIGDFTFRVKVTDARGASAETQMQVRVTKNPRTPIWLQDPIKVELKLGESLSEDLSVHAKELDGRPLFFGKTSGAAWVKVNLKGMATGTPTAAGEYEAKVRVTNSEGLFPEDATLMITVKGEIDHDQVVDLEAPVPSKTDLLWVIDSSRLCNDLINAMKKNITIFFDAIKGSQVTARGMFLPANAHRWDGAPYKSIDGEYLLNGAADFRWRTEKSWSVNLWNTPIWSMTRFYEQLPGLSLYKNGWFDENVPADVFIATVQNDHYKRKMFAGKTNKKDWTPGDFAKHFDDLHKEAGKSLRISAFTPKCPSGPSRDWLEEADRLQEMRGDDDKGLMPKTAYTPLVNYTKGKYYTWCQDKTADVMREYAQDVIRRAYITAKSRIALEKTPTDPATIKVSLNGTPIAGNTGSSSDLWFYDANGSVHGDIVIRWALMDVNSIPPGAKLNISYLAQPRH